MLYSCSHGQCAISPLRLVRRWTVRAVEIALAVEGTARLFALRPAFVHEEDESVGAFH